MGRRKGDWRDLLTTYSLALKPNKIYVGYLAVLFTLFVLVAATFVHGLLLKANLVRPMSAPREIRAVVPPHLPALAEEAPASSSPAPEGVLPPRHARREWAPPPTASSDEGVASLLVNASTGGQHSVVRAVVALLNPFHDRTVAHFILSILTYLGLFYVWSRAGGLISRLTALEYARDDLPTLADARQMVQSRRSAYFMAPVWPLMFFVGLVILNCIGGLVASIPYVGRILLVFPGFPLLLITSILIVMLVLFGVLSFGLMMPAVSVGGKDALDGWSTSYTYVLWGSGRYICYTALAGAIGLISVQVAAVLTYLLGYVLTHSVDLGYVASAPWVSFTGRHIDISASGPGGYIWAMQCLMGILMVAVMLLPFAYAVSYFFSANTVIFFLLRKHVDNIDIDEIYEESEEEGEEFQPEETTPPEPPKQPEGADADEEIPPEVAEEGPPEPSEQSGGLPKEPDVDKDKSMED